MRPTPAPGGDGHALHLLQASSSVSLFCGATCSVEVDERLAAEVVVKALAAVLLKLDLFDADRFLDHLIPLLSSEEAVQQHAVGRDGPALLSDLESRLKI